MTARRAGVLASILLGAVYVATMAPGVTFWDAGEFIAAAHGLGIPHPPGTPLFIVVLNVWARIVAPVTGYAAATNLLSVVASAVAGGLGAWFVARSMAPSPVAALSGVAAALCAGSFYSVWLNATETEVYAASLVLGVAAIAAGWRAGERGDPRWTVLTAYLIALAAPLHPSALVAAPAAIAAASITSAGTVRWAAAAALAGVAAIAMGVGTMAIVPLLVGITIVAGSWRLAREGTSLALHLGVVAVAASALLILIVRAQHDPLINQGDPDTVAGLIGMVGRRQYAVAPYWPRQAPTWLQVANWFQYADWQAAMSLGPTVLAAPARTVMTAVFAALAILGASAHRQADRRGWWVLVLLFTAGSAGVLVQLNLRAGPSIGWGILPDWAPHEARERDYFFVLGFWAAGLWAGVGAIDVARRLRWPPQVGLLVAALPVVLNWTAVDRRRHPEASIAAVHGRALLEPLPERAVLFVSGDNDTYPLWYLQQVEGLRRDVVVVTMPLLGADWYVREMAGRHALSADPSEVSRLGLAGGLAASAHGAGRPVTATLGVGARDRAPLGNCWRMVGAVLVATGPVPADDEIGPPCSSSGPAMPDAAGRAVSIDRDATVRWAAFVDRWAAGATPRESVDPVPPHYFRDLDCPRKVVARMAGTGPGVSLDSLCNLR